jgi:very-short-patch-repair endonuclease
VEPKTIARKLRVNATHSEMKLWSALKNRKLGGFKFRRQAPIGKYVVDFVCHERSLVIEADGGQHIEKAETDAQRTRWLESQGFRVIRFWNDQILK